MIDAVKPCPICGAAREQRADGHLIHTIFTKESWKLHEEEARKSILHERALEDGELPKLNPPLGGYYS